MDKCVDCILAKIRRTNIPQESEIRQKRQI